MTVLRLTWLVLLVLALAACGADDPGDGAEPPPAATETEPPKEPDDENGLAQECTNDEYGFSIRYPDGWHTNDGSVLPMCSFFHPEEFEVPEATEVWDIAVMARREPVELDEIAGQGRGTRVLEREDVEVADRPAVHREVEATGEGLYPEGLRYTQYLVDLEGETLVLETFAAEGLDYDDNRDVLDRMVETLELTNG